MIRLKIFLKKILESFGLDIVKLKTLRNYNLNVARYHDMREKDFSMRMISYFDSELDCLINASVIDGRALPLFSLSDEANHPYIYAVKKALFSEKNKRVIIVKGILQEYYKLVSPKSAGDLIDFKEDSVFHKHPVWSILMPWQQETIKEWNKNIEKSVKLENMPYNRHADITNGWAWTGPTDHIKALIEAERIVSLLNSILERGYLRNVGSDGDILGVILIKDENNWKWQATHGQHRACVLSALGYKKIPIRIVNLIRRSEVKYWPHVVSGLYTIDKALDVFDMVFAGNFKNISPKWDNYIYDKN